MSINMAGKVIKLTSTNDYIAAASIRDEGSDAFNYDT